nr:uncharacterized protein LOC125422844 isoform X2 [Ziziphus jujuba var. spinosa]
MQFYTFLDTSLVTLSLLQRFIAFFSDGEISGTPRTLATRFLALASLQQQQLSFLFCSHGDSALAIIGLCKCWVLSFLFEQFQLLLSISQMKRARDYYTRADNVGFWNWI